MNKKLMDYLDSLSGKMPDLNWWWIYWFIDESDEELNKCIRREQINGDKQKVELYCSVIAIKQLYNKHSHPSSSPLVLKQEHGNLSLQAGG